MAGIDLLTVSKLMAHADIQTTITFYAHLAPDHKRDAAEAFAKLAPGNETAATEAGEGSPEVLQHPEAVHNGST